MPVTNDVSGWVVLIIEDDPDNLGISSKVLSHYGAQVYTAEDGLQGLEVLAEVTPSLILLDLSMPNMDGWEMLQEVRANPATRDLPIIALTAHAMAGDRERALDAGFDGYISKPYRMASFLAEIQKILHELAQQKTFS